MCWFKPLSFAGLYCILSFLTFSPCFDHFYSANLSFFFLAFFIAANFCFITDFLTLFDQVVKIFNVYAALSLEVADFQLFICDGHVGGMSV